MRIIVLQEELYSYLCYVVEQYARGGIDPREGLSLYHLHRSVKGTPEVDESQVAKLAIGGDGNASLSVEGRPPMVCPKCGGQEWRPEKALCISNPTGRTTVDTCTKCGYALGGRQEDTPQEPPSHP